MYVTRTLTKVKNPVLCAEYPMSSKFHSTKWKTYFSEFTDDFLKNEEVAHLIHYVKFKMWPVLFYVNSLCFPNSSIDWKLRFLIVCVRLYLHSPQFKQRLKTGILNVALGWTFQFFTIYERDKKLEFSRLGPAW